LSRVAEGQTILNRARCNSHPPQHIRESPLQLHAEVHAAKTTLAVVNRWCNDSIPAKHFGKRHNELPGTSKHACHTIHPDAHVPDSTNGTQCA